MFKKYELFGAGISIAMMALALYLLELNTAPVVETTSTQEAQVVSAGIVSVGDESESKNLTQALMNASTPNGNLKNMVIDDVKVGTGEEVKGGDKVTVHYIGTLQSGQEFDNSKKRGTPFEFTVGGGQVIKGWEEGLIGMKVGGQRILVIPPELAYGENGIGPIPGNATLVFAIELLAINE